MQKNSSENSFLQVMLFLKIRVYISMIFVAFFEEKKNFGFTAFYNIIR